MKKVYLKDIVEYFSDEIVEIFGENDSSYVLYSADITHVDEFTLDWISPFRINQQEALEISIAPIILVSKGVFYSERLKQQNKIIIVVNNPKRILAKIINKFWCFFPENTNKSNTIIASNAKISTTAVISSCSVLGSCTIGCNTIIYPNVTIYDGVTVGDNCIIHAGSVIGTDGLGCERENDGKLVKFPHQGTVEIGDNVEIGANCQIAKGVMGATIIKNGCKINGLCFIAHNCYLEENVWITGNTMLAGSVHVSKNSTIFSSVTIREQIHIGEHSIIGMGSIVTKNIPSNEIWYGIPAKKKSNNEK